LDFYQTYSCQVFIKSQFPSRSALTFIRIISTARKNISQNLKVGEVLQQNSLKAVSKVMDMMNLPDDIQEEFMSGKFAIKQTVGVFNGQWSNIATKN
jgi:hypothetical protein